ncbi:hypothetical protein C8R46DRAFT_532185 [Mycena filopes]|nr:hypothetical protein C8R46DRAFT_532185 [Mycena filopes]
MQGRRLTTFSFIQYLQTTMSKPLTRRDFTTLLSTAAQHEVHRHFLALSRNGEQLWDGFVRGVRASRGPKGIMLLQGHHYLWGFSQNQHGQWIMDVDCPTREDEEVQRQRYTPTPPNFGMDVDSPKREDEEVQRQRYTPTTASRQWNFDSPTPQEVSVRHGMPKHRGITGTGAAGAGTGPVFSEPVITVTRDTTVR